MTGSNISNGRAEVWLGSEEEAAWDAWLRAEGLPPLARLGLLNLNSQFHVLPFSAEPPPPGAVNYAAAVRLWVNSIINASALAWERSIQPPSQGEQ